jgi:hypothetical protein
LVSFEWKRGFPSAVPFPLLAHQAPVLPLKAWRPAWFNGTALVVGSLAPDLQNFGSLPRGETGIGHSLLGQFVFCLPVTMAAVLLVGRLHLGEVLAARLRLPFVWLRDAATDVTRPGGLVRAVVSALCGSASHVAFDVIPRALVRRWTGGAGLEMGGVTLSPHLASQLGASVVGAVVALWALRKIAKRSPRERPLPRPGAGWILLFASVGATLGGARALPAIRRPDVYFEVGRFYVWGYAVFLAVCGAGAGMLAAGALLAWRDRRGARA